MTTRGILSSILNKMSIEKIVLTGGIASGKTYVSDFVSKIGIKIIDLDIISKEITFNPDIERKIITTFGASVLTNSTLNKTKLRQLVFSDKKYLLSLESILHPQILQIMQNKIALCSDRVLVVVPLLFEKKLYKYFDKAIVLMVDPQIQIQRLTKRDGINSTLAQQMIDSQATNNDRIKITDYLPTTIIENNKSLVELDKKLLNLNL